MTEPTTLQKLVDLEEKARTGDKNARDTLDRMAREEGFADWESEEKEIAKILQPILSKATEAVDRERARREKTPGMTPIMAFARMMMESKNPAHRAFIGTYPYRNIYAAAKKFEEESANTMSVPETAIEFKGTVELSPTNPDDLRVIADSEAGTLLFKKNKQGGLVPQGGSINPGYDVVLVPKPFAFSGTAGQLQLPGSLAGQFETNLNSMEALINRLNTELGIGLAFHGRNDRTAVWSVGNCLIVLRVVDNRLSELELINFRREQSDPTAGRAWDYLTDRLKNSGIHWQPVQDSERVAKKTLANFSPSRSAFDDEESYHAGKQAFEAERDRRKNMTAEQAAEEILRVNQAAKPEKPQVLLPIYTEDLEKVKKLSLEGLTVKVIAQRLAISESTVKRHRKRLGLQRAKQ